MWSLGAILELDDRGKMETFMKEELELDLPDVPDGSYQTIFEFYVSKEGIVVVYECLPGVAPSILDCYQ